MCTLHSAPMRGCQHVFLAVSNPPGVFFFYPPSPNPLTTKFIFIWLLDISNCGSWGSAMNTVHVDIFLCLIWRSGLFLPPPRWVFWFQPCVAWVGQDLYLCLMGIIGGGREQAWGMEGGREGGREGTEGQRPRTQQHTMNQREVRLCTTPLPPNPLPCACRHPGHPPRPPPTPPPTPRPPAPTPIHPHHG